MQFDWDKNKRKTNLKKHGVDFVDAARILLGDPYISESRNPGTDDKRFIAVGELKGRFYTVVYTERGDTYRIISARSANHGEKKKYSLLHGGGHSPHEKQN